MKVVEKQVFAQGRGPNNPQYLIVHETANPGATALNHVNYWASGNQHGEAHYVLDWDELVYHTTLDSRACWHVGGAANSYTVGVEICHATNEVNFAKTWACAVEFCAWWLALRGWGVDRMLSHRLANLRFGTGSDHTDPDGYFNEYGRTWAQFVNDVTRALEGDDIDMAIGNEIYAYLTDQTDESGRGKKANMRTRLAFMAQKQEQMQKDINALGVKLDKILKKLGE